MLYLAEPLKYITESERNIPLDKTNEVSKIIRGLIKSIN